MWERCGGTWKCGERWLKVCWGVRGGEKKRGKRHGCVRGRVGSVLGCGGR